MLDYLLRRPVGVGGFYCAFLVVGLVCFYLIPIELSPRIELPRLIVHVAWPNTSAITLEAQVTAPLEGVMQRLRGVVEISSTTREGVCWVGAEFAEDANVQLAELELGEKIYQLRKHWPREVSWPYITRSRPEELRELEGFVTFQVIGDRSMAALRTFAKDELYTPLTSVLGVEKVEIWGGEEETVYIEFDTQAIASLGLPRTMLRYLQLNEWRHHVLGRVWENGSLRSLHLNAGFSDLQEVQNIPILHTVDGRLIRLKDIAQVALATRDPAAIMRVNGRNVVTLALSKMYGVDLLETVRRVEQKIAALDARIPADIELVKDLDRSRDLRAQIQRTTRHACFSILFIGLMLLVTFRRLQAVFAILISVGFSVLGATMFLGVLGYSLNILILAGFTVGFGVVVDNAVVVYDHIHRRISQSQPDDDTALKEVVTVACGDIKQPLWAANLTSLGALLPVFFLSPELQLYFRPFAVSLSLTLCMSLFISFTFIPNLVYWSQLKGHPAPQVAGRDFLWRLYRRLLLLCAQHKQWFILALLWVIGIPLWLLPNPKDIKEVEWMPSLLQQNASVGTNTRQAYNTYIDSSKGEFDHTIQGAAAEVLPPVLAGPLSSLTELYKALWGNKYVELVKPILFKITGGVTYRFFAEVYVGESHSNRTKGKTAIHIIIGMPNNIHIDAADRVCRDFEAQLLSHTEFIEKIHTHVFKQGADIKVEIKDRYKGTSIPRELYNHLILYGRKNVGGVALHIEGSGPGFHADLGTQISSLGIEVKGFNFAQVHAIADELKQKLEKYKRVRNIDIDRSSLYQVNQYEVLVEVQHDPVSSHGLDHERIIGEMESKIGHHFSGQIEINREQLPAFSRFVDSGSLAVRELRQTPVHSGGRPTRLDYLAHVKKQRVLPEIKRVNQSYIRLVAYDFFGPSYGLTLTRKLIEETPIPYGYNLTAKSNIIWELDEEQKEELIWMFLLAVLLVWMITAALFESWTKPFLVLLAVPLALLGALASFNLFDAPFNRGGYAALLLLVGIVVNNSILLVDHILNTLQAGRGGRQEQIIQAAFQRVRPIFITTTTTLVGLLPLLFEEQTSLLHSLSVGACGGLVSALVLTPIVVPLCFLIRPKK